MERPFLTVAVSPQQAAPGLREARQALFALLRRRELLLAAEPAAATEVVEQTAADVATLEATWDGLAPRIDRAEFLATLAAVLDEAPLTIARMLCRPGDPPPEDLAQDIRLRTWRTPPEDPAVLASPGRLRAWLYKVGWQHLRDLRARIRTAPKTGIGPFAAAPPGTPQPADPPAQVLTPLQELAQAETCDHLCQVVREAIADLPSPYREALQLRFFSHQDLTDAELATRLGTRRRTFVSWVRRGKARLKAELLRRGIGPSWAAA